MDQNVNYEQIALKTHISVENVEYLFNKEFDKLNKIKVNSFIAIIQRETELDLTELKEEANAYYSTSKQTPSILDNEYKEKTQQEHAKKYVLSIVIIVVLFSIVLVLFTLFRPHNSVEENIEPQETNEIVIVPLEKENQVKEEIQEILENKENIQEEIIPLEAIQNDIEQNNQDQTLEEKDQTSESIEKNIIKSIKVVSQEKVWAGIKYLDDMSYEETTANEITLDPNRDFVVIFGHNRVEIQTHNGTFDFSNDPKKRRISYIDGNAEIITMKKLNALVDEYREKRKINK